MWSEDRNYVLFDYQYTIGHGKGAQTLRQTAGAFHCPNRAIASLTARPEDLGDKVSEFFGGQDIDFESDQAFSKQYRLTGEDEAAIREFFSAGGTQFLAAHPGWTVHAKGEWLLAYRSQKRVAPKNLKDFLWDLQGLYGALIGA